MIDPDSGEILLARSVEELSDLSYQVCPRNTVKMLIIADGSKTAIRVSVAECSQLSPNRLFSVGQIQIRVEAYDNGSPPKNDICIVKVTVNRNLNTPRFLRSTQTQDILYTQELGIAIAVVEAEDLDVKVWDSLKRLKLLAVGYLPVGFWVTL